MGKLEAKSARAERSIAGRASVFVLLLGATQCIPDQAKNTWAVFPGDYGKNDNPGSGPGVLVLGDSLVAGINQVQVRWDFVDPDRTDPEYCCIGRAGNLPYPQCLGQTGTSGNLCDTGADELADVMRLGTAKSSFVAAAGGASVSHFVKASLLDDEANLQTAADYVAQRSPRLTVLALGTNDVRIMEIAEREASLPPEQREAFGYNMDDFRGSLTQALTAAFTTSQCVILVNVADHFGDSSFSDNVNDVNQELSARAAADPQRIRVADWFGHSSGHESWFLPNDIHHTPEGQAQYRNFIVGAASAALNSGC